MISVNNNNITKKNSGMSDNNSGAHQEEISIRNSAPLLMPPPPTATTMDEQRAPFKKSHTCGSLYAKCGCNNNNNTNNNNRNDNSIYYKSLTTNQTTFSSTTKRGSTPALIEKTTRTVDSVKRLSNPEIRHRTTSSCSNNKTNVYLRHPEITLINNDFTEIRKSTLDYHKYSALSYQQSFTNTRKDDEEFRKFLADFGIYPSSLSSSPSPPSSSSSSSTIMGNGVPTNFRRSSSISSRNSLNRSDSIIRMNYNENNFDEMKTTIRLLNQQLDDLKEKYNCCNRELRDTREQLKFKESELMKLQREIHKLKSVLQLTTTLTQDGDILSSLQEQHAMANRSQQQIHNKKQGVSAESSEFSGQASDITIIKHEKDFRSKQLIKEAIMDNNFLKNLDTSQVREIVDCMYPKQYESGTYVIREGEAGAHLFVSAEGEFEVIKDGHVLGRLPPGKAFGELAILYNCRRTASIRATTDSKVWVLDRKIFQQIMMRTGLQRLQDNINSLRSVPLLRNLSNDVLAKIADVLEMEFYPAGVYIIRQGGNGDTFFIINNGSVKVTQRKLNENGVEEEEEIRVLTKGDYFGEQALLKEERRTANIIAMQPGVECLTLDRESFKQLIGDLSEIKEKDYSDRPKRPITTTHEDEQNEFSHIKLDDLEVIATLGVGGFGRVELVQYINDPVKTFALKCLKKQHIVDTQQQEHIFNEKTIMGSCRSPFICRLYKTFKDAKYVYMLLEACLGGEVWTILRDRGCFDENTTRFITGSVLEAFDYLHSRNIIYRDLKPENLLLDSRGYIKLVDFGFSKKLDYSNKTWTFCGTPEYVAPETILNKGHDRAVDYWALGILMHELLSGSPPFTASDPMKTYNLILKGIDMVDFSKHNITRSAQSLIKKLCRDSPSERLGYHKDGIQDIKKHKWFQGFDWDGLIAGTLPAPIQPLIRGPCDTTNFDCFTKDNDIPPDELSNWDADF